VTVERIEQPASSRTATTALFAIAAAVTLLHLLTNSRYGFHRDEFQFLSDARHLDWGFVAYPPLTPALEHLSLGIFGLSLAGLRLFSVLFQAASVILTGLMAREFGGQPLAQITAALAVALSPLPLFEGTEFQYSSFDYLWWVLAAYFIIRLLKSGSPRWWLAIGIPLGLGLLTKYSIVFFIAGIVCALLLTSARRYFLTGWFCAGVALALLIFLPNFLWLVRHDFVSYHFLQHIHVRDVRQGRADGFLRDQLLICVNVFAAPLWLLGLVTYLRDRRFRPSPGCI
jgi:4-amino-4-deoxy-L-arabinose transferase-like glycosyltransferase